MASTSSTSFQDFFTEFSTYLDKHYSRPEEAEKEQIRNGPKRVRRLDSFARLINRGDPNNCTAVALLENRWYITANYYDKVDKNIDEIFKALDMLSTNTKGDVVTTKARTYLFSSYLKGIKGRNTRRRLQRDVKKFLTALKTNEVFTKHEIANLKEGCLIYRNKRKLHAETWLISRLISEKGNSLTLTLGISKLCCKLCAAAIPAFKQIYNLDISFRGRHGNFYFAWKPSSLLLETCFPNFVGKKAAKIYRYASKKTQKKIKDVLKDFEAHEKDIEDFFTAGRGGIALNSESPSPANTSKSISPTTPSKSSSLALKSRSISSSSTFSEENSSNDVEACEDPEDSISEEERSESEEGISSSDDEQSKSSESLERISPIIGKSFFPSILYMFLKKNRTS